MLQALTDQASSPETCCLFVVFLHGDTGLHGLQADALDKVIGEAEPFDDFLFGVIAFGFVDRFCVHVGLLFGSVVPARSN